MTTWLGHNMVVVSLKDQVPLVTSQRVNSQNTQSTLSFLLLFFFRRVGQAKDAKRGRFSVLESLLRGSKPIDWKNVSGAFYETFKSALTRFRARQVDHSVLYTHEK